MRSHNSASHPLGEKPCQRQRGMAAGCVGLRLIERVTYSMCGIAGYVGPRKDGVRVVLDNLKRLEYRGYDSAGVAVADPSSSTVRVIKKQGKLGNLMAALGDLDQAQGAIIAHTRWATHGRPSDCNAHPHTDCTGK